MMILSRFREEFDTIGKAWLFPSFSFVALWIGLRRWTAWHQMQGLIIVGFIIVVNVAALALAPAAADAEADHLGPRGLESPDADPRRGKRKTWWGPAAGGVRDLYRTRGLPGIILGLVLIAVTIGFSDWFIREGVDVLMAPILPGAFCAALALLTLRNGEPFGR